MAVKPPIHGRDHLPGGADPIEGLVPAPTDKIKINFSTAADHTLLAGVSGKTIKMISGYFIAAGDVNVSFKSGTTVIAGPTSHVNASGVSWGAQDGFETADGDDLVMTLDAAVQVGGWIAVSQR